MKFITKKIHSWIDYPVAIKLMISPFIFGLGESHIMAYYLTMVTGAAAFILTVLTNHQTGIIRVIPYKIHLVIDFLVGLTFLATPFIFGFEGIDFAYYLGNGIVVLIVVSSHKPDPVVDRQTTNTAAA